MIKSEYAATEAGSLKQHIKSKHDGVIQGVLKLWDFEDALELLIDILMLISVMLTVFYSNIRPSKLFTRAHIYICKEIDMSQVFWDSLYILVMHAKTLLRLQDI